MRIWLVPAHRPQRSGNDLLPRHRFHPVYNRSDRKVNMRHALKIMVALSLIGCSTTAQAPESANLSPTDVNVLTAGYQLIQFDLVECKAVQGFSNNKAVLALAGQICAEAKSYEPELERLAQAHDVMLPNTLTDDLFARDLGLYYGMNSDTDVQYLTDQIKSHKDALAVFQEEVSHGQNSDLIAVSRTVIPVVQGNLTQLRQVLQSTE